MEKEKLPARINIIRTLIPKCHYNYHEDAGGQENNAIVRSATKKLSLFFDFLSVPTYRAALLTSTGFLMRLSKRSNKIKTNPFLARQSSGVFIRVRSVTNCFRVSNKKVYTTGIRKNTNYKRRLCTYLFI